MNVLSKPEAGWSQFSLDDQLFSLSYLTNIPCDWLDQAIQGIDFKKQAAFEGDAYFL